MKSNIYDLKGEKKGEIDLPNQFKEEIRPDLIKKSNLVLSMSSRQSYGGYESAGKSFSADISRRRKHYKGAYGKGLARVPRKTMLKRGTHFVWIGAFAPGTVGGRRAHPPKVERVLKLKINKKERLKALRSAIACSTNKDMLKVNGFYSVEKVPLILSKELEKIEKVKEVFECFCNLKLDKELERTSTKGLRLGKGKVRGRKYKTKTGILVVTSGDCSLVKAARNLLGVDVCFVSNLNTRILSSGDRPGRLVVWTETAIEKLRDEKLFMNDRPRRVLINGSI